MNAKSKVMICGRFIKNADGTESFEPSEALRKRIDECRARQKLDPEIRSMSQEDIEEMINKIWERGAKARRKAAQGGKPARKRATAAYA
ncbi:MAG: hypothetical protein FWH21_05420 [Kiritimatiellaeota bacterium]|nr:hypothetical protein [Kiritimatiellota bacterium]